MLVSAAALVAGLAYCKQLESRYIHALAPEFSDEKLQGAALQKEAFRQPDLLMVYGSSELVREIPNNANEFFEDYPTGFRVFPIGKPGATSLGLLQKLAAVGKEAKGRKVAYSLSPGWFLSAELDTKYYEGNFSNEQALQAIFSDDLSHGLKHDIARRMDDYPTTTDNTWLLDFTVHRLSADTALDRALYAAIWPLGKLRNAIGRAQDHFGAAVYILDEEEKLDPAVKSATTALNWNEILKRAAKFANATAVRSKQNEVARRKQSKVNRAAKIREGLAKAHEWTDFELLLRTCQELGAKPLFLSMPIEDIRLEVYGLDDSTRLSYVQRLQSLVKQYEYPVMLFREHEKDPGFMDDFQDHLSAEGWLYFDKALDDFYHGRI